jgi:hypothetical protein
MSVHSTNVLRSPNIVQCLPKPLDASSEFVLGGIGISYPNKAGIRACVVIARKEVSGDYEDSLVGLAWRAVDAALEELCDQLRRGRGAAGMAVKGNVNDDEHTARRSRIADPALTPGRSRESVQLADQKVPSHAVRVSQLDEPIEPPLDAPASVLPRTHEHGGQDRLRQSRGHARGRLAVSDEALDERLVTERPADTRAGEEVLGECLETDHAACGVDGKVRGWQGVDKCRSSFGRAGGFTTTSSSSIVAHV